MTHHLFTQRTRDIIITSFLRKKTDEIMALLLRHVCAGHRFESCSQYYPGYYHYLNHYWLAIVQLELVEVPLAANSRKGESFGFSGLIYVYSSLGIPMNPVF